MAGAYTPKELLDIYQKLKDKQDSLEPYLTIRMMADLLGYSSPNSITNILKHLEKMGLVKRILWPGAGYRWKFLERND